MAEAQGGLIQAPALVAETPPASQHKNFHHGIMRARGEANTGTELGAGEAAAGGAGVEDLALLAA